MHGAGRATLSGDHLTFELKYYLGDEYVFECEWPKDFLSIPAGLGRGMS